MRHFLIAREDLGCAREQIDAMIAGAVSLKRGEGVDGEKFFAELERQESDSQRKRG